MDSTPKTCHLAGFVFGNHDLCATVFKVVNGQFNDLFGIFQGIVLVKFNVNDVVLLHLGNGIGW